MGDNKRQVTRAEFERAIEVALERYESSGDAQAKSADLERSYVDLNAGQVVLVNKPLSGWRFGEVRLTTVPLALL